MGGAVGTRERQRGVTLVELLIVMVVIGVISTLVLVSFTTGNEALGRVDDDARGQQDLRIVSERLSRDLRAARGVDAGSTTSSLTIWIDRDANYRRTPDESFTWSLAANASDPKHFNINRSDGVGSSTTVGEALVSGIAFSYDAADVTKSKVVTVTMAYDPIVGAYLDKKQTTFQVRMRNVQ